MYSEIKRKLSVLLVIVMFLSICIIPPENVHAGTTLPSVSSSRYISTYTYASSGKVYAYKNASLSEKTGGYIACATDECRIIAIQGNAVKVSYPVPGGRKTAWFYRDKFTYRDLAAEGAKQKFKSTKKVITYKWKNKNDSFGYIASGDVCYLLRGDANSDWLQVIYPTGSTYKMGWVKGSDIKTVIWPEKKSITLSTGNFTLTKKGQAKKITATVSPSNSSVSWKSSNTNVATVSNGTVTAKANGTATITASISGGISKSVTVTVKIGSTSKSNQQKVKDRLNAIASGKYRLNKSTVLQVGKKFVGTRSNEQCKGYAKDVFYCCFRIWPGSTMSKPNNHKLNSTSGMKMVASTGSVTKTSASKIFKNARPGDFVQIRRRHGGSHSAIVYSVTSKGVTFIEANLDGKNTIYKRTYTWAQLAQKNQKMTVYTATNYKVR